MEDLHLRLRYDPAVLECTRLFCEGRWGAFAGADCRAFFGEGDSPDAILAFLILLLGIPGRETCALDEGRFTLCWEDGVRCEAEIFPSPEQSTRIVLSLRFEAAVVTLSLGGVSALESVSSDGSRIRWALAEGEGSRYMAYERERDTDHPVVSASFAAQSLLCAQSLMFAGCAR